VDRGLISQKGKGLTAKSVGIFWRGIIFQWENLVDQVHDAWTGGAAQVHGGPRWHLARAWPPATLEHGSSSTGAQQRGEHGDPSSGLTGARMVMERQRDGGDEWQQLELSVRAKEGAKELRREGERGGEGRGCSSPFIGAEGAPGRGNGQW
jgi:hypothetical protein